MSLFTLRGGNFDTPGRLDRHGGGGGRIAVVGGLCPGDRPQCQTREENRMDMKEALVNRLARLLCVKSLVTLALTVVFAVQSARTL